MTLRKITFDNSVRSVPKNEQIKESKQKKLVHFLVNKTRIFHKTIKRSLKTS